MFEKFKAEMIARAEADAEDMRRQGYRVKSDAICRLPKRVALEVEIEDGRLMEGLPKVIPFTEEAVKRITKRAIMFPYAYRVCLVTQSVGVTEEHWHDYGKDAFAEPDDFCTLACEVWNRNEGFVWNVVC